MNPIEVFDARLVYGRPYLSAAPQKTLAEEMASAGATRAIVEMYELSWMNPDDSVTLSEKRVIETPGAYGLAPLVSALTGEMRPVCEQVKDWKKKKTAGFFLTPGSFRIPIHPIMLKKELSVCEDRKIPVFFRIGGSNTFEFLADIMERTPNLTLMLSVDEEWPNQRKIYPLLDAFPNLYLMISEQVWAGALKDMTERFGAERLLYSSSHPKRYAGGTILMVENAGLTAEEKSLIYGKNLESVLGGMCCD